MSLKQSIKRPLLHVAANVGPHRWPRTTPGLWILMYHRVLPAHAPEMQDAEPGMVVTPESLSMQLSVLKKWGEPVFLDDWLERKAAGKPLPKRAVAITFDDGWLDNYQYAFPVLKTQEFPATIFLVSDWIGTQNMFWPERLARILRLGSQTAPRSTFLNATQWLNAHSTDDWLCEALTREQLYSLFNFCKQWPDLELHDRFDSLAEKLSIAPPETPTLMTWDQVNSMQKSGVVRFGSHTCRHVRLNDKIDTALMVHEITASKNTIQNNIGQPVKLFCYPNGDHTTHAVTEVKKHYLGAVTTQRGYNNTTTDPHLFFRVGVHNDVSADPISFLARLSCWF